MNATRIGRLRRALAPDAAPLPPPPAVAGSARTGTRRERSVERSTLDAEHLERLVLVTGSFAPERAAALLEGLRARERASAQAQLAALAARASSDRQARAALLFGPVSDAPQRLRCLMAEAPQALQAELLRRLPPYYRSFFPGAGPLRLESCTAPLARLAERLIREATR